MLIKDHWYIACASSQLLDAKPRATQIGGTLLVVYRTPDGKPHALLDRCPHRGVRLSLGRIRNGRISCGYHGWEFESSGKLGCIPALGQGGSPPAVEVTSFPTIEADHYVWVWMAGTSAEPTYQPQLDGLRDGLWFQNSGLWQTNVMPAIENQLDAAHPPFAHPGIYPGHETVGGEIPPLVERRFECVRERNSVVTFSPPRENSSAPVPKIGEVALFGQFELPFRNYVYLAENDTRAIYNWIPLTERTCRLEFMVYSGRIGNDATDAARVDGLKVVFVDEEIELLSQDRVLLESAQHWPETDRGPQRSLACDAPQLMARKLVKQALNGTLVDSEAPPVQRRIFQCATN